MQNRWCEWVIMKQELRISQGLAKLLNWLYWNIRWSHLKPQFSTCDIKYLNNTKLKQNADCEQKTVSQDDQCFALQQKKKQLELCKICEFADFWMQNFIFLLQWTNYDEWLLAVPKDVRETHSLIHRPSV